MIKNQVYDVVIVGGGIAGINTAMKISKTKRVLLLDERKYWGGRISTKYQPRYEVGAARFSNKHKILNKLINKFKLTKVSIPKHVDYIQDDKDNIEFISDVHKSLDDYFKNLVAKSTTHTKSKLQSMTLYEFMNLYNDEETSQHIVDMFGYYSEIKMMSAYDALNTFKEDFVNVQYYTLREGLTHLCNEMIQEAKDNGCVCKYGNFVTDVKQIGEAFEVSTKNSLYKGLNVVFAVKGEQLKQFDILKSIHEHSNCLHNSELLRIYAKYPLRQNGAWFNNLRRTTTNSFLRQIIPINYEDGLIMVSYTDGKDVESFKVKKDKLMKETKIKDKIHKELNRLFGGVVPQPTYFKVHYWSVGAHHWKPDCDSSRVSSLVLNPSKNLYICGEAFSHKQAWIEGALETSEMIIGKINSS